MEWNQVRAKWSELRGRAKDTWGRLTDDDLETIRGKRDLLVGKLIQVYGLAKEEAEREALAFAEKAGRAAGRVAGRTKSSVKKVASAARRAGRGALGRALDGATAGLDRIREKMVAANVKKEVPSSRGVPGGPKAARSKNLRQR